MTEPHQLSAEEIAEIARLVTYAPDKAQEWIRKLLGHIAYLEGPGALHEFMAGAADGLAFGSDLSYEWELMRTTLQEITDADTQEHWLKIGALSEHTLIGILRNSARKTLDGLRSVTMQPPSDSRRLTADLIETIRQTSRAPWSAHDRSVMERYAVQAADDLEAIAAENMRLTRERDAALWEHRIDRRGPDLIVCRCETIFRAKGGDTPVVEQWRAHIFAVAAQPPPRGGEGDDAT